MDLKMKKVVFKNKIEVPIHTMDEGFKFKN